MLPFLQGRVLVRGEGPIANLVGVGVYPAALLGTEHWYKLLHNLKMTGRVVEGSKYLPRSTPILPSRCLS